MASVVGLEERLHWKLEAGCAKVLLNASRRHGKALEGMRYTPVDA